MADAFQARDDDELEEAASDACEALGDLKIGERN
jgi:hypothetical protein